jgi:hypothetical protein
MELITSSSGAKRASLTKTFMGKDVLKVGKNKFELPNDISKVKVTQEQSEMTGWRMLLIILLAITIIGLILAIPLYFAGKKKRMVMALKAVNGETFSVATSDNNETKILSKYSSIGVLDD